MLPPLGVPSIWSPMFRDTHVMMHMIATFVVVGLQAYTENGGVFTQGSGTPNMIIPACVW